jgi:hypothetical protein
MMMGGGGRRPPTKPQSNEVPLVEAKQMQPLDMQTFMKKKGTTAYPRINLAPGQRFASKGAYLQKIDSTVSGKKGEGAEWIVP